jgi:hypothetical protein
MSNLCRSMTSWRWTWRWPRPDGRKVRGPLWLGVIVGCAALATAGCGQQADKAFKELVYRPTPQRAVLYALQEENPDARRRYLRGLINRKELKQDWAIKALDVIARTDADPQVRCIAIQGLGQSGRPEAVDTALAILNPKTTTRPVRTGEEDVRLDCLNLLLAYLQSGRFPADRMEAARQVMLKEAADDQNSQARMAALRGLRYFPQQEVLRLLVNTLRESTFGLQFEAEMSLRCLTGRVGDFEASSWEKWLAATQDPFAGRNDYAELQRSQDTFWRRSGELVNEMWTAWQGPSKPTARPSQAAAVKQAEGQRLANEAAQQ